VGEARRRAKPEEQEQRKRDNIKRAQDEMAQILRQPPKQRK